MNPILVKSKVGSDGVLRLSLPVGMEDADREVDVTIGPSARSKTMTPEEWHAWVDSMAGTWQGDFERSPQGEYETREKLS